MDIGFISHKISVCSPCLGVSHFGTEIEYKKGIEIIEKFLELGGNFLDTAHVYAAWLENGSGASERTIGRIIAELGIRDQIVLASAGGF